MFQKSSMFNNESSHYQFDRFTFPGFQGQQNNLGHCRDMS